MVDNEDFQEEFKALKSESLLKKFIEYVKKNKIIDEKFKMKI